MKTTLKTLGSLLALLLATFSARADVVLADNFDSYATGDLTNNSAGFWLGHSGAAPIYVVPDSSVSAPNALQISSTLAQDVNAKLTNAPYYSAGTNAAGTSVTALYFKFTLRMSSTNLPTAAGTYFAHLKDTTTSAFRARVYASTNGALVGGSYRVGIANSSGTAVTVPTDLSTDTTYTIVVRYVLAAGVASIGINPINESDLSTSATDTPTLLDISTMAFRQASGEGTMNVDDLVVGTAFSDAVAGAGPSLPAFIIQPQDTNTFIGNGVTFSALATGTSPIAYQWYYNTNTLLTNNSISVSGVTNTVLTLTNLTVGQAGTYSCVASNTVGTNVTRFARLTVNTVPIPPIITNQPVDFSSTIGDTATFTVVAGGSTPLAYQWQVDNGVVTNNAAGANLSGTNGPTLAITSITTPLSGLKYFVTITNQFGSTNSAKATLTVNPPSLGNISTLHAQINPTTYAPSNIAVLYKVRGIVTTWANMTGTANTSFYMQDASGGILVYWAGAPAAANLPPAGALVEVVGPLASFGGVLEISPFFTNALHSLTVISTGNPLPQAMSLPFDPSIATNMSIMKKLESSYFVASNVLVANGATFTSGLTQGITNIATQAKSLTNSILNLTFTNAAGQSFIMYINSYTDIPGQAKPTGPVTIYGVLGFYSSVGFEFTPSRYADIVVPAQFVNVLSNVTRMGDLLTNSFTESVVRPTETLTMTVTVTDPGGSSVTIAPSTADLPASASWDGVASGSPATANFHFTPTPTDAGVNYIVGLGYTINGVTSSNFWYVYVPTVDEQKLYITEFLANPTTNIGASYFNPLHRSIDNTNITTVDQYVEIVNMSGTDISDLYGWSVTDASTRRYTSISGTDQLLSSNAVVIYGGAGNAAPALSVPAYPANASANLALKTTGMGVIVLRNPGFYNNALGNKPGYIVDRIVYNGSDLKNGSLSRFPTINDSLIPQAYISTSTNLTTAGLQYYGAPWSAPTQSPKSVSNIVVTAGNPVSLSFTANINNGTTLWMANTLGDKFRVISGNQFANAAAQFQITNPPPTMQFYFITTQTNY